MRPRDTSKTSWIIALLWVSLGVFGCNPQNPVPKPSPSLGSSGTSPSPTPTWTPPIPTPSPTPSGSGFDGAHNIPMPPNSAYYVGEAQDLNHWSSSTGAASQCPGGVASSTCNPVSANYNPTVEHPTDPIPLAEGSGITSEFQLYSGPSYATVVWGHSLMTELSARNFIWDFYVYLDTANEGNVELDLYDSLSNGQRFMMGSQCDRSANTWDTWSEIDQHWVHNPSIPCNELLTAGAWHHVTFYNTIDSNANTYTYKVLRIDGTEYVLDQTQSTQYVGWPDGLIGVQVQLDANKAGSAVNEYIESMQVYAW